MNAEEFLHAALRAGAQVEFVDGRMVVVPRTEVEMGTPDPLPPQETRRVTVRKPGSEPNKSYTIMKEALAEHTTSHIAHIAAALAVLHGARTGEWMPGIETLKRFMNSIDLPTLVETSVRATNLKHAIKVRGKRITMSTGAFSAAMYDAMEADPNLTTVEALEPIVSGTAMDRKIRELAASAERYGGSRAIEFRRQSYKEFKSVMLGKEV